MYQKVTLRNGIRVVMERIPHFRSVSIGLWFGVGSIHEDPEELGLAHFIEHMLFKGTKRRTAKQIAEAMDCVGGQINAFTAKECTCYYSKVMDEHLPLSLDLLSDMVLHSVFEEGELEKEKGIVLEEIYMYDDSPEDLVHDLLSQAYFGSHPLSQPILGTPEGIPKYTKGHLIDFYKKHYLPRNLVISVAGNFEDDTLLHLIESHFGDWSGETAPISKISPVQPRQDILYRHKDIEQIHLCLAHPGISMGNEDIYPMLLFNNIFGGGMSSRLFQRIREDKGLAYSVFSYPSNYTCDGLFTIYAGMKPAQTPEVLDLILMEIDLLKKDGILDSEFIMGREQLKGNYILGMESTNSRMTSIGKAELLLGKVIDPAEVLERINKILPEKVNDVIHRIFAQDCVAAALVGPEDLTARMNTSLKGR